MSGARRERARRARKNSRAADARGMNRARADEDWATGTLASDETDQRMICAPTRTSGSNGRCKTRTMTRARRGIPRRARVYQFCISTYEAVRTTRGTSAKGRDGFLSALKWRWLRVFGERGELRFEVEQDFNRGFDVVVGVREPRVFERSHLGRLRVHRGG